MKQLTIDVGGTFTDCLVLEESGQLQRFKAPTTPDDPTQGFFATVDKAARHYGRTLEQFLGEVEQIVHRHEIIKIILPHAAALIFAGLRLGLAMGFIGIVIAELLITPTGIGDLITYHSSVADYPEMFAAIASIIAVAAFAIHGLQRLEHKLFPPEIRGSS